VYEQRLDNNPFGMGTNDYTVELYVARLDGSARTRLTYASKGIDSLRPSWSPDGRQILFVSGSEQGTGLGTSSWESNSIMIMNSDGTQVRQLALGNFPTWSPNGTRIAYMFNGQLRVMQADGSNAKSLAMATRGIWRLSPELAWSPDGTTIAFNVEPNQPCVSPPCEIELHVISPDGGTSIMLAKGFGPEWSPTGQQIAFKRLKDKSCDTEIYVMNRDGSNQIRLADGDNATWSPDGKQLAFDFTNCYRGTDSLLHCEGPFIDVINADGTGRTRSMEGFGPKWLPDGRIIETPGFVRSSRNYWDLLLH
jgi:Tol biopolymer transport system component